MALTNYLMQSVVCALVFTAWGARQMGLWSPLEAGGLALVIFLAQTAASAWWMRRHAYGPVEWFLRALTVGVWPQWRRTSDSAARPSGGRNDGLAGAGWRPFLPLPLACRPGVPVAGFAADAALSRVPVRWRRRSPRPAFRQLVELRRPRR